MLRMEAKHQSPKCALNESPHPEVGPQAGCKHSLSCQKTQAKAEQDSAGNLSQVVDRNPSIAKSSVVTLSLVD
jgi:hypothetical protein